jgi:aminoglycoside phosphotransferase (APT) family kinase protein
MARTRLDVLDTPPRCLVHGELYPGNLLVGEFDVRPVDWQSVAIGRGEIDLASLLEGWSRVVPTDDLVASYRRRRWPGGAPEDFLDALAAARLYWPMRWLGDRPRWTLHPTRRGHVRTLRAAAQACGIAGAQEGVGA